MIVGFVVALFGIELTLRNITNLTDSINYQEVILTSLVMIVLMVFSTRKFTIGLAIFILIGLLFQISNAVFYGGWIDPMNIYLFFENLSEVVNILPN